MKKTLPVIVVLVVIAVVFIGIGIANKGKRGSTRQIVVIPKGTTHIFWQSVRRGAQKAGDEAGVKIFWNGPKRETDRQEQIRIIEDFIALKVSGVVLAPNDSEALIPKVEELFAKNIPCVIIDSGISTDKHVPYVVHVTIYPTVFTIPIFHPTTTGPASGSI